MFCFLKVGTAVVTRGDGRLALGRLGALCEQVILNLRFGNSENVIIMLNFEF